MTQQDSASSQVTTTVGASELREWQHLHPLSPIVRGGVVGIAILGYAASQFVDDIFRSVGGGGGGGTNETDRGVKDGLGVLFDHSLVASAIIVVGLLLIGIFGWLSWHFARFRVAGGQLEFRKGWVFREHRQVPLERVQAIEISRPLLAQLTGLSQVIVQSAGAADAQLKLAFLGAGRAEQVRSELLALAGRRDEASRARRAAVTVDAPDAGGADQVGPIGADTEGREVLSVPNSRLFVATILHGGTILLAVLALVAAGLALAAYGSKFQALTGAVIALPALGPLALGVIVNRVSELLKHGNFHLADTGNAARIQHGLTDKRTTTIPLHRIQAVGMVQPLWWRPLGWWRVKVNVAGIASDPGGTSDNETTVLPVGTLDQALAVLTLLDPVLSEADLRTAALGDGPDEGCTLVSPHARTFDALSWRRSGFAVSPHSFMVRAGRLSRRVSVIPHARVQSLRLTQGPLDQRFDLATVTLVSTPGPVGVVMPHLELATATQLLVDEATRARNARQFVGSACITEEIPSQLGAPAETDER